MGWESNKKAKQADLYPKSVGEVASNENQVIQPFKWTRNADRSLVTVTCKNGYILDSSCIDGSSSGVSIGSVDFWAWSFLHLANLLPPTSLNETMNCYVPFSFMFSVSDGPVFVK